MNIPAGSIHLLTDEKFLYWLYSTILGRDPDAEGLEWHLQQLRSGTSRLELIAAFSSSDEARQRELSWSHVRELSPAEFVSFAYRVLLDHGPSEEQLRENVLLLSHGLPREALLQILPEAAKRARSAPAGESGPKASVYTLEPPSWFGPQARHVLRQLETALKESKYRQI